ncbi:hypothetical protein GX408_12610 [bacterium]|nr:hypothetical protein [bacterium]
MKIILRILLLAAWCAAEEPLFFVLENNHIRLTVEKATGAISSFFVKANQCELISEKRLQANFRICLPLPDYQANYLDGMRQKPVEVRQEDRTITVRFDGMSSAKGIFPIKLSCTITLQDDYVVFKARLINHHSQPISEFWFPRLGGWTQFGDRTARLATPNYTSMSRHTTSLFKNYPGSRGLGAEAAEWACTYPGMVMPWWDLYDEKSDLGLYLGYHDPVFRFSSWHTFLMPDHSGLPDAWLTDQTSGGLPVGLVFSHIRFPFIHSGEILDSGEFIIRVHQGDWHQGVQFYRDWFLRHFTLNHGDNWLRHKRAWFTSILYQPEDKIIADYQTYGRWCGEAAEYGISCYELIGWHRGGLERNYPDYQPEEKLGGRDGFRGLMKEIDARQGKCLAFINYNILDQNTDWYKKELFKYKQQDQFGQQPIWMGWGESTFLARSGMNVRYHVRGSITPDFEKLLADQFIERIQDGAHGFQIDKLCVGAALDFNPLNALKPDVALCQGLVQAVDRLYQKCRTVNPAVSMASEFSFDRLLPYFAVGYRGSGPRDISTFRFVFPEWTSCQHIARPQDFNGINYAVLSGQVICVEPECYQGSLKQPLYHDLANYIKEVERLRDELHSLIFYARYFDNQEGRITPVNPEAQNKLQYRMHGHFHNGQRALVVINTSAEPVQYAWAFTHQKVAQALLYQPFVPQRKIRIDELLEIKPYGLQILVERISR